MDTNEDVPSPIDLRNMDDARQWAESASVKRPWRSDFFAALLAAGFGQVGALLLKGGLVLHHAV